MTFVSLTQAPLENEAGLTGDYRNGHEIGVVRVGRFHFFFRRHMKVYYIAYEDVTRFFRRVQLVPARLCCGRGDFQVENLVVCTRGDREVAMVQLPGTRAAEILMRELQEVCPHARFGKPGTPVEAVTAGEPGLEGAT